MKKVLLILVLLAVSATSMAKETERYIQVKLESNKKNSYWYNIYAYFEGDGFSADGLHIHAPAGRTIHNVNIQSESFYGSATVCGTVEYKGKSVKVKVFEMDIDDGECAVAVVLDNGESYELHMQNQGT